MPAPRTPRAFSCCCGRPVFFRNSECLACHTPLGYDADLRRTLLPLEPAAPTPTGDGAGWWHEFGAGASAPRYRRCSNHDTAAACNWLVGDEDVLEVTSPLCRSCRLTRTLPDLSVPQNGVYWHRIELAKRRLVSSLIGLRLPVAPQQEDPRGLVFDLLRSPPGQPPVLTGHAAGVITINVEEAEDAWREQCRVAMSEPYRTLLGHLRHETGHHYWDRLVRDSRWLQPWREAFGDERQDYAAALQRHHQQGAPADWDQHHVSAYASCHPWEDWAETWAHYLHLVDTLDTARSFGLDGGRVELHYEPFTVEVIDPAGGAEAQEFLQLIQGWMELTGVLNELSRSMGVADFYPFVLGPAAVRKLYLAHRVIRTAGAG